MGKSFDHMNYYEMLDIHPNASAMEIRSAYNAAMQMYQPDSLVSYSFFSQEERNKILFLLEKAYLTLINEAQRVKYDNELHPKGTTSDAEKNTTAKKPVNIFDINRQKFNSAPWKNNNAELKTKISQNKNIAEILSRQEIRGTDLRTIRNELGIAIETIHQETKIRLDYLNYIEEDKREKLPAAVFLKGFIKAYLKSLCVEPADEISARYMSSMNPKN
jgi:DnaJ-class molecular chaperone